MVRQAVDSRRAACRLSSSPAAATATIAQTELETRLASLADKAECATTWPAFLKRLHEIDTSDDESDVYYLQSVRFDVHARVVGKPLSAS